MLYNNQFLDFKIYYIATFNELEVVSKDNEKYSQTFFRLAYVSSVSKNRACVQLFLRKILASIIFFTLLGAQERVAQGAILDVRVSCGINRL